MRIFIIALIMLLTSCIREEEIYSPPSLEVYPLDEVMVNVRESKAMIVRMETDTIAVLTHTSSIAVPKYSAIDITEIDNSNNSLQNRYKLWEVVAFEDSRNGDYDYNDLVIHTEIEQRGNNTYLSIHPIALGSTKKIALGIRVDGKDHYISTDCRADLFENREGFINTWTFGERVKYETFVIKDLLLSKNTYGKSLDWFIEVDGGTRLYAISKNYPTSNRAYGLILIDINPGYFYNNTRCGLDWFDYPSEGVSIETVYPDYFDSSKTFREIYSNKQSGYYPAVTVVNGEVTEDCLYAIKD